MTDDAPDHKQPSRATVHTSEVVGVTYVPGTGKPGVVPDPAAYAAAKEDADGDTPSAEPTYERKPRTPAAQRALAEAAERRRQREAAEAAAGQRPAEHGGRKDGTEPVRYGDWEKNGIAWDF